MSYRKNLLSAVFGMAIAMPALAQQDTRGIQALLDQANYWRLQNRPELVIRTLERVLAVDPNNADALAGAAQAQAQVGNRSAAEGYLARLRQAAPQDPRVSETDINVRAATVDQGALAEARRLGSAGRTAEAIARYRELFRGNQPPDNYAVEYYQTLAGTEAGYTEARDGLGRLARRYPTDQRLGLAYAQVLTFRDETRGQGIDRLRDLAQNPEVSNTAVAAWRQAVLWQGPSRAAVPQLEAFMQRFPNDTVVAQRLEEARTNPQGGPDPASEGRIRAFESLQAGRTGDAIRGFEQAVQTNPNDADALGGLGIARLRQGRFGEARQLLERAIAANPEGRSQWEDALNGASYAAELATARAALARGDLNTAETNLRRAVNRQTADRADAEALLGDLALRRGDMAGAEQRYRAALARRPNLGAAASGLFEVLNQQGRFAEAEQLRARMGGAFGGGSPESQRAYALRAEAARAGNPAQAAQLLTQAVQADPANPWARLDLARIYASAGRSAEGRQIAEGPALAGGASPDQLHAAALYASDDGRPEDVLRYLSGIPVRLRSPDMNRLLQSARTDQEARQATALYRAGRRGEARAALTAIASRPDPSGASAAAAIRAMGRANDRAGAAEAGRAYVAANPTAGAQARLAVAGALLSAGATNEAAALSRSLEVAPNLSAEDRRQAAALASGLAIQTSDQLNQRGDQAAAFDVLAPALQRDPSSVPANLALARLYQGAGQPQQARQITEGILQRDPRNIDARVGAIEAAIAARDFSRAEALLVEARALNPNDPRVALTEARIARASGNSSRALRALELAAEQRRAQGVVADVPASPEAAGGFDNPFRRLSRAGALGGASMGQSDPLSNEISRELTQVREETAMRIQGGMGFRSRSGSAGFDRLDEYSAPIDASFSMPGVGGRTTISATPVSISSGQLDSSSVDSLRRYGSNALSQDLRQQIGSTTQLSAATRDRYAPRDTSVSGASFGIAYTRGAFSADIGTSPIGFRRQNILGGIEIAPALSNNFRIRLIAEQRAVTDSLLSWSGVRDPYSGATWGGVVRSGGRVQLEYTNGPVGVYMLGGYSTFTGTGVARNNRVEAGVGMQYTAWRLPNEELTIGVDGVFFAYDNNQRLFTLGNGGYFSPQSYFAVNIPIDWRARSGNFAWRLGGTIGYQSFREDAAKFFPRDAALQTALEQSLSGDTTLRAIQPGQSQSGITGGVRADLEYAMTQSLRVGALLRYERTGNWEEARGLLYARYRFDR
ncbi:tetratricopeptide repeat protein [Rhodovarius crocodyli]|uniref:Tetratricopeptide repeat protein n=1 Tax=Rhodovarius crocodyli TaxID=1979269 RepID=A0A437MH09_9PROT|nr:cellulose synthase subunit BcsC-related outer membrane protein [Rhodovarius crocodyli]RVT96926.1 tetratricopeptide repeat protein [Rhodovarius crocodyli]